LDDPRVFVQYLPEIMALMVGKPAECPDAVEVAWLRRVEPQDEDTNHSRWPTDAAWRVVQAAKFTYASKEVRQLTREVQTTHAIDKRVQGVHGGLISFAALIDDDAEHWDLSHAVREVIPWLEAEAIEGERDFGKLVRERRRKLGLPVQIEARVLPFERRRVIEGTGQEPAPDEDDDTRLWLVEHAWRCALQAEHELEIAQQNGAPEAIQESLGERYTQRLAEYARLLELFPLEDDRLS
jgi:hypothetical protein